MDLEGDLVYVAVREDAGEDVEAGVWGLASGQWAVVVTADSRETSGCDEGRREDRRRRG